MFGRTSPARRPALLPTADDSPALQVTLLAIMGDRAKLEGRFDIADSIQIECEIGGELNVGGKLVIGEKGVVRANVRTVDAVVQGRYEGNMVASGNVEIAATGRVIGNVETDSLVIAKGGFFNGDVVRIKEQVREREEEARRASGSSQAAAEDRAARRPFWPRKVSEGSVEGDQGLHRFRVPMRSGSGVDAPTASPSMARSAEAPDQQGQSGQLAQGDQAELELREHRQADVERPEAVEAESVLRGNSASRPQNAGEGDRGGTGTGEQEESEESRHSP